MLLLDKYRAHVVARPRCLLQMQRSCLSARWYVLCMHTAWGHVLVSNPLSGRAAARKRGKVDEACQVSRLAGADDVHSTSAPPIPERGDHHSAHHIA